VQVDRESGAIRNADGVKASGAASLLSPYGKIEDFPPETLGTRRDLALLCTAGFLDR